MSSLQIHFIRNVSSQRYDDVLTIRPHDRMFDVTYEDHSTGTRNHLVAPEIEVLDFVESIFELMPLDDDPFEFIQLTCPCFPAVLLKMKDIGLSNVQTSIWRLIKNTLKNWPTSFDTTPLRYASNLTA
jgi:hypothetical protein